MKEQGQKWPCFLLASSNFRLNNMSQKQHHKPFFHIKLFIFTCLWDFKIKILYPLDSTAPSAEDHIVTARIGVALSSIDVALHDHLIIGEKYSSSQAQNMESGPKN